MMAIVVLTVSMTFAIVRHSFAFFSFHALTYPRLFAYNGGDETGVANREKKRVEYVCQKASFKKPTEWQGGVFGIFESDYILRAKSAVYLSQGIRSIYRAG
jgi:hypothetical protein